MLIWSLRLLPCNAQRLSSEQEALGAKTPAVKGLFAQSLTEAWARGGPPRLTGSFKRECGDGSIPSLYDFDCYV